MITEINFESEKDSILKIHAIIIVKIGIVAYKRPALDDVVISKPRAINTGKNVNINIPIKAMYIRSFFWKIIFLKLIKKNIKNNNPVNPYLTKLMTNGSREVTKALVNTKVVPPSIADKDEQIQPIKKYKLVFFWLLGMN